MRASPTRQLRRLGLGEIVGNASPGLLGQGAHITALRTRHRFVPGHPVGGVFLGIFLRSPLRIAGRLGRFVTHDRGVAIAHTFETRARADAGGSVRKRRLIGDEVSVARRERAALVETLLGAGPDAPTLCEGWRTRDLAAHLVIREHRLDAAPGILIPLFAGRSK